MKNEFSTKIKAEEKLQNLKAVSSTLFCPLINSSCRQDCICFNKGSVNHSTGFFYIQHPRCENEMFQSF